VFSLPREIALIVSCLSTMQGGVYMPHCLVRWIISCFSRANITLLASPHSLICLRSAARSLTFLSRECEA
jgi:hypothetical protein